jgi:DNA repair/transcription protein MET18/MMS19
MQIIDGQSSRILQNVTADSPPHKSTDLELASSLYAVATGMVRRYSGKQAQALLTLLREAPKSLSVGSTLAHRLEMVVAPQRPLDKESFAIVKPLWRQKIYIELVKPVLETALAPSDTPQGQLVRTNVSIAVLRVVKHLSFSIYEDDAEKILRIAISVAQNLGGGVDAKAALDVLRDIMVEASDQCQPHLRSIITICINAFSTGRASDSTVPEWLPKDYIVGVNDLEVRATGGQVALGIVGGLPQLFEARHLLPHSSQVQKELTLACGNTVRSLRKSARIARAAWASIN